MATPSTAPVRRWIVRVTIGSFSLAALLGIVALLSGGEFGETEGRILLTTLLVGVVSIAVLCFLTTAGRRSQPVGVIGGVTVLVPLVTGLLLIWVDSNNGLDESMVKTFAVSGIVAATLAQICLLLAPDGRDSPLARRMLAVTIGLAALLALLASLLVLGVHPGNDGFYRAVGVVAILDVLGTVVGAALLKFGPGATSDHVPGGPVLVLPPDVAAALAERAAATGRSRDEVAAEILRTHLTPVPSQESAPPHESARDQDAVR
jgi:F0F1-type ATP synthase assembly protein I